jgi:hypothetical protein
MLFLGNSLTGQLVEALSCQLRDQIMKQFVTRLNVQQDNLKKNAAGHPLAYVTQESLDPSIWAERQYGISDGHGLFVNDTVHASEVSYQVLRSGAAIYQAINNKFLYNGSAGLSHIGNHFKLRWQKLDCVVIGDFNTAYWAQQVFTLKWRPVLLGLDEIIEFLESVGFKGKIFLYMSTPQSGTQNLSSREHSHSSQILPVLRLGRKKENAAALAADHVHACVPGTPSLELRDITSHFTGAHRGDPK